MDAIFITAAVVLCLAIWIVLIIYARRFISRQGDDRSKSVSRTEQCGLLGAAISAAKSLLPDEKTGRAGWLGSLEDKNNSRPGDTSGEE